MQVPVQVTFHGLDHSAAVEERVLEKVAKLEQFCSDIISCRVTVELHHKNTSNAHRKGEPYLIGVSVSVPGDELIVKRSLKDDELHEHEDVGVALRDAFQAMERQVKEYVERRRATV
ncbi:HPF/RaiA family ribosome-associated protein [Insolitispirillum peregrinum]|uniref:Ribosome-associated translation inhibitor RaiA n=1 Tax=Insolitispirillum peregrinum TaxID=80876 RepID=A0A1N7JR75_9PROT|nr:HPF/RaiA family ribosome-associated protein [Insolitispirillum peregrinum]SIS51734.1 Ribosome-associated translation inhibitor RaiA [Insolitispirillum peregrinum]